MHLEVKNFLNRERYFVDIGDPIKTTVEEIRKILNIDKVIGKSIESDDKILIPVTRMGMAFGQVWVKENAIQIKEDQEPVQEEQE